MTPEGFIQAAAPPQAASEASRGGRIDAALEWLGERCNPILVKEARQALKSRQFVLTFGLLLIAAWAWSLIGLVMMGSDAAFGQTGPSMFMGYYVILAASLGLFVPFGAFRSLAGEQEDRTYELLSITDLSPAQIVSGKLGSAVVQMLIYLSAVAPCLAFTYMLRGLSLPTILLVVGYTTALSLGLSVVGLLAGTLTSEKHWQVLLSVALIVGLLFVFGWTVGGTGELVFSSNFDFRDAEFWQVVGAIATAYVTYFALAFFAAVARITFASDNRSTRLRMVMLVQHVCCTAWFGWLALTHGTLEEGTLYVFLSLIGFHWYIMGVLMTGEWPELSMRVKRRLPQSFLGRVLFTWFNPGPGTGYMFACCGMIAGGLTAVAILTAGGLLGLGVRRAYGPEQVIAFAVLAPAYVIAYLGAGLLIVRLARRLFPTALPVAALIQVILVLVGVAGPLVLESIAGRDAFRSYSLIQISNPFWSIIHLADRSAMPPEAPILLAAVPFAALVLFLLNLPGILHEVRQVRVAKPRRVAEEDDQIAAEKSPPQPVQISPWDTL